MAETYDEAIRSDQLQPGWVLYIGCDPAVRLWSGIANIALGPGAGPDTAGGVYAGLGIIVSVPSLTIPLNGDFVEHVFSLSGVSSQMMALMKADANAVRGARINWATVELNEHGAPIAAPVWIWTGRVNTPRLTRDGSKPPPTPPTRTVGLVCSTGSYRRGVSSGGYWTGVQQRSIDANDSSCDRVSGYASSTSEIWPT